MPEPFLSACCTGGVIVRPMTGYGYPEFIRINVGLPKENKRFLEALDDVLQKSE